VSLTLDPTLAAAQDATSRHPIIEIMSMAATGGLPLTTGAAFDPAIQAETCPILIAPSSGGMAMAYALATMPGTIRYGYTGATGVQFTMASLACETGRSILGLALCDATPGNVGIVTLEQDAGTYWLTCRLLTLAGVLISSADIAYWTDKTLDPALVRLASGTIILAYSRETAGLWHLCLMTTTDFVHWTAQDALTLAGISTANQVENPSFIEIAPGHLWLLFDYVEASSGSNNLTNVWYSVSTDGGNTWAASVKLTAYASYSQTAAHPVALSTGADSMDLVYDEVMGALHLDSTASGWKGPDGAPSDMHFDPVSRHLYLVCGNMGFGVKSLGAIIAIDVDTWTVVQAWTTATVPALPSIFDANHDIWFRRWHSEGGYVLIGLIDSGCPVLAVLNAASNTVVTYAFGAVPAYGVYENVSWTPQNFLAADPSYYPPYGVYYPCATIQAAWIDSETNRLYVVFGYDDAYNRSLQVGYIDLTDQGTMGPGDFLMYGWNNLLTELNAVDMWQMQSLGAISTGGIFVDPGDDILILSYATDSEGNDQGCLRIHQLSTGALLQEYTTASNSMFPYGGIHNGFLYREGVIYGGFAYQSLYGEEDKRGLCIIDTATGSISFSQPPFITANDCAITEVIDLDGVSVIVSMYGYAVAIYNNGSWTAFDNADLPGMTPSGENNFAALAYDPVDGSVFAGNGSNFCDIWAGVIMFNKNGLMHQPQLMAGTLAAGAWTFAAPVALIAGFEEEQVSIGADPSNGALIAFWANGITGQQIYWAEESVPFPVSPYLLTDADVSLVRTIDGHPSQLVFQVADGHLFDPHNLKSLWSQNLKKGRKLTLRLGELVSGEEYWANQGTFFVTGTQLTYGPGQYPAMSVTAEDARTLWGNIRIIASPYYQTDPVSIISDLVTRFNPTLTPTDLALPASLVGTEDLTHQFIEVDLASAVTQVAERFGYFDRMDANGNVGLGLISNTNPVSHVYPDLTKIMQFSPDDSYSDFTNQIIVTGQTQNYVEVLHEVERVGKVNGTQDWHCGRKDYTVYYSLDETRTVANPYLVKINSVQSLMFKLAGSSSEEISFIDPNNKYCIVTITTPDLTPELIGALAMLAAAGVLYLDATVEWVSIFDFIPAGIESDIAGWMSMIALMAALQVLASTATFQYEVWGSPIGYVRQSVQGEWDDDVLQGELGSICMKKIDNPLCYTEADCEAVANFEGMVVQSQRARVTFQKVMHLQDEEADTIQAPHPWSGDTLTIFITKLTRQVRPGANGYAKDTIEGWDLGVVL
jgi:hypothetical protein